MWRSPKTEKIRCTSCFNFKCGLKSLLHIQRGGSATVITIVTPLMSLKLRVKCCYVCYVFAQRIENIFANIMT